MSLDTTITNMYDRGLNDDTLVLLKEANTNISISVNSPFGETKSVKLDKIVAPHSLFLIPYSLFLSPYSLFFSP